MKRLAILAAVVLLGTAPLRAQSGSTSTPPLLPPNCIPGQCVTLQAHTPAAGVYNPGIVPWLVPLNNWTFASVGDTATGAVDTTIVTWQLPHQQLYIYVGGYSSANSGSTKSVKILIGNAGATVTRDSLKLAASNGAPWSMWCMVTLASQATAPQVINCQGAAPGGITNSITASTRDTFTFNPQGGTFVVKIFTTDSVSGDTPVTTYSGTFIP